MKRGSPAIDTEVPVEEKSTVAFLNGLGFLVHAHLDSPYRRGDVLYRISKALPRMYTRDPFDLTELTSWTLDVGLGFQIDNVAADAIEFSKPLVANGQTTAENEHSPILLSGIALVHDSPVEIESSQLKQLVDANAKRDRSIIIASGRRFSAGARKLATKMRVMCFRATISTEVSPVATRCPSRI